MTSAESFRIALVGCGRISKNHFDAIRKVDGLSLAAVCDIDAERARRAGEEQGVPAYRSIDEMLRASDDEAPFDIVVVCTPSGLHSSHGAAAARAGKHVVTEKPMSISLTQADELVHACDEAGVQLFVVKQLENPMCHSNRGVLWISSRRKSIWAFAGNDIDLWHRKRLLSRQPLHDLVCAWQLVSRYRLRTIHRERQFV